LRLKTDNSDGTKTNILLMKLTKNKNNSHRIIYYAKAKNNPSLFRYPK
jgi:hypothetical protein